jgi:hypothetical protein
MSAGTVPWEAGGSTEFETNQVDLWRGRARQDGLVLRSRLSEHRMRDGEVVKDRLRRELGRAEVWLVARVDLCLTDR